MKGIIYKYTNNLNQKVYVGQTMNEKDRKRTHKKNSKRLDLNSKFYNAVRKYGWDSFTYEKIEETNRELLNEREMYWVDYYDSYNKGYNLTLGGDAPMLNRKHSQENIERMKGKKPSEETLKKLSESQLGELNGFFGKKHGDDTLEKMRLAKIKFIQICQYDKEGNFLSEYDSFYAAAKAVKGRSSNIKLNCEGSTASAYGFKWKYKH